MKRNISALYRDGALLVLSDSPNHHSSAIPVKIQTYSQLAPSVNNTPFKPMSWRYLTTIIIAFWRTLIVRSICTEYAGAPTTISNGSVLEDFSQYTEPSHPLLSLFLPGVRYNGFPIEISTSCVQYLSNILLFQTKYLKRWRRQNRPLKPFSCAVTGSPENHCTNAVNYLLFPGLISKKHCLYRELSSQLFSLFFIMLKTSS